MSNPLGPDGPQRDAAGNQPDPRQSQGGYGQQPVPGPYGQQPPPGWQPQQLTHAEAAAQARAAKAHAKALRPWFKKKRFIVPLGFAALVAVIGIASSGGGGDQAPAAAEPVSLSSTSSTTSAPAAKNEPSTKADPDPAQESVEIGQTTSAGDWEFKVTKFRCGITSVGDEYLNQKPQGQYCFLTVEATNNGDTEGTLSDGNQKLVDTAGKEYSSDSSASLYKDSDSALFLKGVNPGNTAKGLIVFDIPKKAKPTQAQLSGGVFGLGGRALVKL